MQQKIITINSNPVHPKSTTSIPLDPKQGLRDTTQPQQINFFLNDRIVETATNPADLQRPNLKDKAEPHRHNHTMNSAGKNETHDLIPSQKAVEIKRIEHFSYAKMDEIGLGFSSRVYKGKNDKTNERVAVKVIDLKSVVDNLHHEFINEEVAILEKIKISNTVNLLKLEGVFKTKNNMYIITEFCEGKDMGKILRKRKQLSEQEAQGVMKQLLHGYKELYALKTVHRDLKLANIFVRKGVVKIADFGFAIGAEKCDQKFDYNVGSPYYMPPESLKFNRYSYKSDVWAIGVIAFELVHGKAPWKDRNDAILFEKITSEPIQQLIDPQLKLSQNYRNFIKRCLTVDFDRRATVEIVTSYPWDLAKDFVEGIEQKKIPAGRILQHANSMNDNHGTERQLISGNELFKKKTVINHQVKMEDHQTNYVKHLIEAQNKGKKAPGSTYQVQQTIVAQLHYCRFLNNLYEEMHRDQSPMGPPNLAKHHSEMSKPQEVHNLDHTLQTLKSSISERIINKIQVLAEIVRTNQNLLKIPGFQEYIQTPAWEKLKGVIGQYQSKFYQQFKTKPLKSMKNLSPENTEQVLISTIKSLKATLNNHSKNLRLLELLTFYFQIIGIQKKNNPSSFAQVAKMDLLGSKKLYESVAIERLVKKLEYMGL